MSTKIEALAAMVDEAQYWGTITTPYKLSLESSRRMVTALWDKLGKKGSGFSPNRMLWVAEPHRTNGYHLHWVILLDNFSPELSNQYWTALVKLSKLVTGQNGRCEVKEIKGMGAATYCAKYIVKLYAPQNVTREYSNSAITGKPMITYHYERYEKKLIDWDLFIAAK